MTNAIHELGFGDTDFDKLDDGDSTRCTWNECVCTESPTHYVVFAEHAGGGDAQLFCARHYVLTLAQLIELHLPECSGSFSDHVLRYGALAE